MLDLLDGRNVRLSEPAPSDDDWYLNLVRIERQKCLLLTHSRTLFAVFRAGLRVADLRPLGDYVVEAIETELGSERLPADTFSRLDRNDVRIAKTASRSTLGYMKEMTFELEWHIAHDGKLALPIDLVGRPGTCAPRSVGGTCRCANHALVLRPIWRIVERRAATVRGRGHGRPRE